MQNVPTLPTLALAVLVGACGGGSGGSTAPAPLDDELPAEPLVDTGPLAVDGATDCGDTLPCVRTDQDAAVTVRLTAAQGEQADDSGDFRLDFSVMATRALELGLARTSALTAGETRLDAALVTLDGRGSGFGAGTSAALVPGTAVVASVEFLGRLPDDVRSLDVVTLALSDGDNALEARFRNVPAGPPEATVDCALSLPCAWTSPDAAVTVMVDDVGVRTVDEREGVMVGYGVSATRQVALAAEGYNRASGDAGTAFTQSVLELDGMRSLFGARLAATLAPGAALRASVGFAIDADDVTFTDGALDTLALNLFELREPRVPYWNPVFLNLPLGR